MVGLIILTVLFVYAAITLITVIKVEGTKKKVIALLIFILIPTADVIVGNIYFSYLCHTQSGQFIYKKVELEDEYFLKSGDIDKSKHGNNPVGYAIAKGGEINKEMLRERYDFPFNKKETLSKILHIYKRERIIIDKTNNNILSKSISFIYGGGWVVNIYPVGTPCYCEDNQKPGGEYIHSTLFDKTFLAKTQ
jgi:hypothetical protein